MEKAHTTQKPNADQKIFFYTTVSKAWVLKTASDHTCETNVNRTEDTNCDLKANNRTNIYSIAQNTCRNTTYCLNSG